jgi:hypothetical protein
MRAGRLILLLIVVGVGLYLWKNSAQSMGVGGGDSGNPAPVDRARTAAARANANTARSDAAQSAVDSGSAGAGVTENMTKDQVRALLGPPSDTRSQTLDNGVVQETWTYDQVGKTVVFENGVAISVR